MATVKIQTTWLNVQSAGALASTPCTFVSGALKLLQA
jgi:hypothetical protein